MTPQTYQDSEAASNGSFVPASTSEPVKAFSLRNLLSALQTRWWIVVVCFAVVFTAVALYTFTQPKTYKATALLRVGRPQTPQLGDVLGAGAIGGMGGANLALEIETVTSPQVAIAVAESLMALGQVPETKEPLSVLEHEEGVTLQPVEVARRLTRRVNPQPYSQGAGLLGLAVTGQFPHEAALIANVYADKFVDYSRDASRSRSVATREFLDEITNRLQGELNETEERLIDFLDEEGVVSPDAEAQQLLTEASTYRQSRNQTRIQMREVEAALAGLKEEIEATAPGLAEQITSGEDLVVEGLKQKIATLQLQREEIYANYPELRGEQPTDRRLVNIERQIQEFSSELNRRAAQLVEDALADAPDTSGSRGLGGAPGQLATLQSLRQQIAQREIEMESLRARLEGINQYLAVATSELSDLPDKRIAYQRLGRELETKESLYQMLLGKLQEARIAEQSEGGNVTVVSEALAPPAPVGPNVPRNLAAGAALGLLLGIGLAFARDAADRRVRTPEDLRQRGYNLLGVIPDMSRMDEDGPEGAADHGPYDPHLVTLLNPLSPVSDGYRRLRTNLEFVQSSELPQVMMITSPGPGEGKTVTASNLAVALAQSGRRTLYIDADLRRPRGHRMLGVPIEPGLTDYLQGDKTLAATNSFADVADDLRALPAGGKLSGHPTELLRSHAMRGLLERLREEFEAILIDTAPVLAVADAVPLAVLCDAVILVSAAGETHEEALRRSVEALRKVNAPIAGVVLNRYSPKAGAYYERYGYYGQYGYGDADRVGQSKRPRRQKRAAYARK